MQKTTLGRTGLQVSRMGLGGGGHSRLGLATGGTAANAERIVQTALTLGVNFIDTSEANATEEVIGRALTGGKREHVVLSTKAGIRWQERRCTAVELQARVEAGLRRLQTDYVDIFHLHSVSVDDYSYAREEMLPALQTLQVAGKIRFLGITEAFSRDPGHQMLSQAVEDDPWDVIMVGFNLLNQSARERVLAWTRPKRIGTLCMFAVRRALSQPVALRQLMDELTAQDLVDRQDFDPQDPLGFLTKDGTAASLPEAAYRYCRWEPGIDVVLSGTGNAEHLRANAYSLSQPPLPNAVMEKLQRLFARVDSISGN